MSDLSSNSPQFKIHVYQPGFCYFDAKMYTDQIRIQPLKKTRNHIIKASIDTLQLNTAGFLMCTYRNTEMSNSKRIRECVYTWGQTPT